MITGYLVDSGLNPYQPQGIIEVFSHPLLQGLIPRFGYPPPWTFVLSLAFQLSYRLIPNIFLYNFMTKIPIILANIGLAYLVRHILIKSKTVKGKAQFAFIFLLFNPFTILTSSAWGQFDTVTALICVASLYLLNKYKTTWSALTLALAFSIKPIILPLLGLPLLYKNPKKSLSILIIATFTFFILPFLIIGWQLPLASDELTTHFRAAGGLTFFGIIEIFYQSMILPQTLEILGFLWIPALIVGYYYIYRYPPKSQTELFQKSILLVLIFFLTRSWLSEPNINLILPLMLIAYSTKKLTFRNFHFAWIIPLIFMFFNYSIPQLLFLPYPTIITELTLLDTQIGTIRLVGRFIISIIWQIFAWNLIYRIIRDIKERKHNKQF
jgi:Gpi18-like mannosyltransferase